MKKAALPLIFFALLAVPGFLAMYLTRAQNPKLQTTTDMNSDVITLPAVQETRATLFEALQKRSSTREYASEGLTLDQLSGLLWAAAGENRPGRLTAPSAMALYPVRTYAVLPQGIYLYDAPTHKLTLVKAGDHRQLAGLQDFVYSAPLNIMYIADLAAYDERLADMPETDRLRLCAMDAAGYCQNANLWAAANGMGSVTRAGARGDDFLATISAPPTFRFILAQTVGLPASR